MTEKDLKRLSRADLLEMMIEQGVELKKLQERLDEAEEELNSRRIIINEAGSIADASLQLNGVFSAAQAACEQYMENIRTLSERQEKVCRQREEESKQQAAARLAETESRCASMEAKTKEKCAKMVAKAKAEANEYWERVYGKLEAYCSKHTEMKEIFDALEMKR